MLRILSLGLIMQAGFVLSAQIVTIAEIQGTTDVSPYTNQTVSTAGAVTGIYKDSYFIRESSEPGGGLYVYDPGRTPSNKTVPGGSKCAILVHVIINSALSARSRMPCTNYIYF